MTSLDQQADPKATSFETTFLEATLLGQTYTLKRYPFNAKSQLRAWDAADHYLLDVIEPYLATSKQLCIVNDSFGALALALADKQPVVYSDSWLSWQAMQQNFALNKVDIIPEFISDLNLLPSKSDASPDLIIGRVPKQKSQLAFMLERLNEWADDGAQLFLAGMDKHLSKGQFELLESCFGPSSFLPGVKKARVWQAKVDKTLAQTFGGNKHSAKRRYGLKSYGLKDFDLELSAAPNVFSGESLDIGTRLFLEHFDTLPASRRVGDLACGNGVLGLAYLKRHPESEIVLCDESFQAIHSTEFNLQNNFEGDLTANKAKAYADDGFKSLNSESLDLVLCNPPFHQNNTISTDIATGLFKDAKRCLSTGGELWIVANRHLGYHISLKRLFGNCTTEASNKKFVILKSVKQ